MSFRQPDLTCFRWFVSIPLRDYRRAEQVINEHLIPALTSARTAVAVESAYVSKKVNEPRLWLTVFASAADTFPLLSAVTPHLAGLAVQEDFISDPAKEELLLARCDEFRAALDVVTQVALDIHARPTLADDQRALISVGVAGRTSRQFLEPYLVQRSPTLRALRDSGTFWSVLRYNCLADQQTDALHWLYNIILGFDFDWVRGEAAIRAELGL